MTRLASAILLAALVVGCAHSPRRSAQPTALHPGCYRVRTGPWTPAEVPRRISLDRLPRELSLVLERDSREKAFDAGWRLALIGNESRRAAGSIYDGAWWPVEDGGVEVRLGDAFSGIHLRLRPSHEGFIGEARTYQDVGDISWRAPAALERTACVGKPKVIDQKGEENEQ